MKTLELKLKKDVLIVDGNNCTYISDMNIVILGGVICNIPEDYEFFCKGSELHEEIASEFFEYDDFLNRFEIYIDTVPSIDKSALKLFIKIFESKGFYWLENPYDKLINVNPDISSSMVRIFNRINYKEQWQEAEEKTFRNPLIFVKK